MSIDRAIKIANLVEGLASASRVTRFFAQRESVTDHTVMLQLLVLDLLYGQDAEAYRMLGVTPQEACAFALVHDLPEAICGDTPTFDVSAVQLAAKETAEREAFRQIDTMLSHEGQGTILPNLIALYERQDTPSARFVRYLDKVLPKLLHRNNGGHYFWMNGYPLAAVERLHQEQEVKLAAQYPEFASTVGVLLRAACEAAAEAYLRSGGERQNVANQVLPWLKATWPGEWKTLTIGWNQITFGLGTRTAVYFKHPDLSTWWYSDDSEVVIPADAPRFAVFREE